MTECPVSDDKWGSHLNEHICISVSTAAADCMVPINIDMNILHGLIQSFKNRPSQNLDLLSWILWGIINEPITASQLFLLKTIIIALASHLCTCVLHRQLCYLHTLKLPKFFNFHGDFHQKWHFAHPEFSFAHPELPFLAKSMTIIDFKNFRNQVVNKLFVKFLGSFSVNQLSLMGSNILWSNLSHISFEIKSFGQKCEISAKNDIL